MAKKRSSKTKPTRQKKGPTRGVETRLDRIEISLENVAQQVAKNTSQIGNNTVQIANNTSEIVALRSDMNKGFDSVNGTLIVMERSISDLVTVLKEGHSPKLAKHEQTLDNHENRITSLELPK